MSPERDKWMFEHMTDMPLSANICPIPLGADSIRRAVDYLAVPFTMMTPMHARAEALGWNVHQLGGEIGRAHVELQSLMRISYAVFCLKKTKEIKEHGSI